MNKENKPCPFCGKKEADWLSNALVERGHILGCLVDDNLHENWREAARKAVSEADND